MSIFSTSYGSIYISICLGQKKESFLALLFLLNPMFDSSENPVDSNLKTQSGSDVINIKTTITLVKSPYHLLGVSMFQNNLLNGISTSAFATLWYLLNTSEEVSHNRGQLNFPITCFLNLNKNPSSKKTPPDLILSDFLSY